MAKIYLQGDEARTALLQGIKKLADIVTTTLGPKGRNVTIERRFTAPVVWHDGVSIAKEVELPDPFENMGVNLLKEAALKTVDGAGDGTTTSILLAYKFTELGMLQLSDGANPMSLKKGIDKAVKVIVQEIAKQAKPLKTTEEITQVATISSASAETGKLIAEAVDKVGKDGLVTVEEGSGIEDTIQYSIGMEFEKGFASPHFVLSEDKIEAEVEDPYILITDYRISRAADIYDFLLFLDKNQIKNLFIIAPIIEGEGLEILTLNHKRGALNCLAVNAPGFDKRLKEVLEDIAVVVGAKVVSKEAGDKLEEVTLEQLGKAGKVWADATRTRIIGGAGKKEAILSRITQIKGELEKVTSEWEKFKLNERIARLAGGAAIIKVGAPTEIELKERKERVIDAVEATKAAVAEGIVAGAGITLLNAREILKKEFGETFVNALTEDERKGIKVIYDGLKAPFEKILTNAGAMIKEVESKIKLGTNLGYDVETEQVVDLIEKGILDPAKVTRLALQNASSVSSMILTSEVVLAEEKLTKTPPSEDES